MSLPLRRRLFSLGALTLIQSLRLTLRPWLEQTHPRHPLLLLPKPIDFKVVWQLCILI